MPGNIKHTKHSKGEPSTTINKKIKTRYLCPLCGRFTYDLDYLTYYELRMTQQTLGGYKNIQHTDISITPEYINKIKQVCKEILKEAE